MMQGQSSFSDSIKYLPIFVKEQSRLELLSSGFKVVSFDNSTLTRYQSNSLSELLQQESSIYIKSYGPGGIATPSLRGGSAAHTSIIWNGININSPLNGLSDLALMPLQLNDEVHLQYGGGSALWGSGSIGGSIHLNSINTFQKIRSFSFSHHIGSFGMSYQNVCAELSNKIWSISLKAFKKKSENNFPFQDPYSNSNEIKHLQHAQNESTGLILRNSLKLDKKNVIDINLWKQSSQREIPPNITQLSSEATQKDNSNRFLVNWKHSENKWTGQLKLAYINENILYNNPISGIDAFNNYKTSIAEYEVKYAFNNQHLLSSGIQFNNIASEVEAFSSNYIQNRMALFSSYRYSGINKKLENTLSIRKEVIDNQNAPTTFSNGTILNLNKTLALRMQLSTLYRLPSLNDLYWVPGGNPDLKPEYGYSAEVGSKLSWKSQNKRTKVCFEPTYFNRYIYNWIIWMPHSNYWQPKNIMEVWSRGWETFSLIEHSTKKLTFLWDINTSYVVSTSEKKKSNNDLSIGKQLIYVPMYSAKTGIGLRYKTITIRLNSTYTGYRNTSNDGSEFMEPFNLVNFQSSYNIDLKNYQLNIFLQANNIFNEEYQLIINQAMPLSNFMAGVQINFNYKKSTS
jgi:iron complex outermembrane receptor protein